MIVAIQEAKKLQNKKNDYCLQQVLDDFETITAYLLKIEDNMEESRIKYITPTDLPDLAFKHLLNLLFTKARYT